MKIKVPTIKDKYFSLRQDLYNNTEPYVILEGSSMILDVENTYNIKKVIPSDIDPQELIGITGGISHESHGNNMNRLNNLIKLEHGTPFESLQLNFLVKGISKSCGAQMSRYRVGQGHVSKSGRYTDSINNVYNIYTNYTEEEAKAMLINDSNIFQSCIKYIQKLRKGKVKREDTRRSLPVSFATSRRWFINIRALRYFLKERLDSHAEWEIQRIACILFYTCIIFYPACVEDLLAQFNETMKRNEWMIEWREVEYEQS